MSYRPLAARSKGGSASFRGVGSGRNARERQFIKGEMGRNKFTNQVGRNEIKRDKKNKELGLPDNRTGRLQSVGAYYSTGSASPYTHTVGIASKSRTALDTRPAKSDSSTLHAILFCVLAAIVISWALGY